MINDIFFRDIAAMTTMHAILHNDTHFASIISACKADKEDYWPDVFKNVASASYDMADAMAEARKEKE